LRITLLIASLILFSSGIALSYLDKIGGATATYSAAVFCLIFVFLTEFRKFKGFGVEAELLERKIDEADKILKQLRDITSPIAEMLFSTVARSGRIGAMMPRKKRHELMERIELELISSGVSKEQIDKSKTDWHYFNTIDLAQPAFTLISGRVEIFMSAELDKLSGCEHDSPGVQLADSYRDKLSKLKNDIGNPRLPENILSFINDAKIFDDSTKRLLLEDISKSLSELKYYINNREFNDIGKWFSDEEHQ